MYLTVKHCCKLNDSIFQLDLFKHKNDKAINIF